MKHRTNNDATMAASVDRKSGVLGAVQFKNVWEIECVGPDGKVKWVETYENLIPNVGLDEVLNQVWKGAAANTYYVGLTDGTPTEAAGDTMASHAGWVEVTAYSESVRQTLTLGTVASQSVDNSASKASFSINADTTTIGGAFLTTNSTKSGTAGILMAVGDFTGGDKSADNGDTLNVTVTLTAASA